MPRCDSPHPHAGSDRGAALTEHALLIALVSLVALGALSVLGLRAAGVFDSAGGGLEGVGGAGSGGADDDPAVGPEWAWTLLTDRSGAALDMSVDPATGALLFGGLNDRRVGLDGMHLSDGVLEVDASLLGGPGYGVFVRSTFGGDGGIVSGYSVQVDPGAGGLVVRRWTNGSEGHQPVARLGIADLPASGTLRITLDGALMQAEYAGHQMPPVAIVPGSGDQVGLRGWSTRRLGHSEVRFDSITATPR